MSGSAIIVARDDVDGVVVTHGTDSLEESAYLCARSIDARQADRVHGGDADVERARVGWPGQPADAARVAASADAPAMASMVVMASRIYAGIDVTKAHTDALDAFESPGLGPIGVVDDGRVIFRRALADGATVLDPPALGLPVDIVLAWAGADARLLDASRATARGLVIAAMGRGNVPPAMVEGIERWVRDGSRS